MITIRTTAHFQPEKSYVMAVVFGQMLGVPYQIEFDLDENDYQLVLPNGNMLRVESQFWNSKSEGDAYAPSDLPASVHATVNPFTETPLTILYGRLPVWMPVTAEQHQLCFDLFASVFYMLTRWEEKVIPERDEYQRFPARAALAFKHDFLQRPVVNEWVELLWQCLLRLGYAVPRKQHQYQLALSCDVDHPRLWWQPWQKLKTMAGAIARPNTFQEWSYWYKNYLFNASDPFDTFHLLMEKGERAGAPVQFNFLGDRPRHYDCWYPLQHPFVQDLMQQIHHRGHRIGFHPSREAHTHEPQFAHELASIRAMSPQPVISARHHYLCFDAPVTWQRMVRHGIQSDSTAGYSEAEGFRCGICMPFPVFDIENRVVLPLMEHPLMVMDVTLALYQQLSPPHATARMEAIVSQVRKYNGQMTLLWHNSSIHTPFWEPYLSVWQSV